MSSGDKGAQWLSNRALDWRPRGHRFEPHRRHSVVSSNNTHLSLLSTGLIQEDLSGHTEKLLTGKQFELKHHFPVSSADNLCKQFGPKFPSCKELNLSMLDNFSCYCCHLLHFSKKKIKIKKHLS